MTKPETARRLVVDYTRQEMIGQGITRLTMDTIAQGLGMSKRTLYQLFPGKSCLVQICLSDLAGERKRLLIRRTESAYSCVDLLFGVADEFILMIHSLGYTLLNDLVEETGYHSFVQREEAFWTQQFVDALNRCKACACLLSDVSPDDFGIDLITNIYDNCLRGVPRATQQLFTRTLLRGIFRADAIPSVDQCVTLAARDTSQ